MKKKILYGLLALIILIQLIPAGLPEVIEDNPDDFLINNEVSGEMATLLRTSCYDCHSNETQYPWYSYVAPVKFLIARDTKLGRGHLNLSEWQSLDKSEKAEAYYEMAEEVSDGEMPMKIYPIMHAKANLTSDQRNAFATWAETAAEKLYE